jgi:hypothetical protein
VSLQVDVPSRSSANVVVFALTIVLPQKSCEWEAPGWSGNTIGSSFNVCENWQVTLNLTLPSLTWCASAGAATDSNATAVSRARVRFPRSMKRPPSGSRWGLVPSE